MHPEVQELIEFAQTALGPGGWHEPWLSQLEARLERIGPEHFHVEALMPRLLQLQDWGNKEVFKSPEFDLGMFFLHDGFSLEIHDHPSMTVWMKILWGAVRIESYDWAEEHPMSGLARRRPDLVLGAGDLTVLRPKQGNLHRLTGQGPCVFLDLLAPPYCMDAGRWCHYYREVDSVVVDGESLVRLETVAQ